MILRIENELEYTKVYIHYDISCFLWQNYSNG